MNAQELLELQGLLQSKALAGFIESEYGLITTLMGASNLLTVSQWQAIKCGVKIPGDDKTFDGIYTKIEDLTGESLGSVASSWDATD